MGGRVEHRHAHLRLHESYAAAEALEKWSVPLFQKVLPRHLQLIFEINRRLIDSIERSIRAMRRRSGACR